MLDKAIHLIPDLISFFPLYVYVQPHLCKWHSFYQQYDVSLNFFNYSYFLTLFSAELNLFSLYKPENVNVFGNGTRM